VNELRILPLLASATEIVHELGLGEFQVGRSHECDYPNAVLGLPVCSAASFPVDSSSRDIDRLVKERLQKALSIYELDSERIRELRPTHIITQTQCKVCAVSLEDVEKVLQADLGSDAAIVALEPYELNDLWRDIQNIAAACGVAERGEQSVSRLRNQISGLSEKCSSARTRPRVAAIEWIDPLMAAGNWVPELIQLAHAENLFGEAGAHSPWMSYEELRSSDPDAIVLLPCGFDLQRTRQEACVLQRAEGWMELKAVRSGEVFICDGNQFMNRPGPRLVESLQIFAEMLHPELFPPSFEGNGWERL
jgi:iron complex transport system substrate-binding protein